MIKTIVCPHCQITYTDDIEVLAVEQLGICLSCDKDINYTDLEKRAIDLSIREGRD